MTMYHEGDEYTKYPYRCEECGRQYAWSAEDLSWGYEQPFMPCGHSWGALDMVFEENEVRNEAAS